MKEISLYAYSTDDELLDRLHFLLSKVEADVSVCNSYKQLEKLYKKSTPEILLIDDNDSEIQEGKSKEITTLEILKKIIPRERRSSGTLAVMSSQASEIEYKVDMLLHGADYIIVKPVNTIELTARVIAMVRHQKYIQKSVSNYITQTRDIATFDTMDKMMEYLNEHIRPIIQEQINIERKNEHTQETKDYINKIHGDAIKIIAALNAVRDDLHEIITSQASNSSNEYDHLDKLFKKNLDLVYMAYKGHLAQ